jgi:histidinol-phosphate aminotransferase
MATSKKAGAKKANGKRDGPSEIAPGVFVGGWRDAAGFAGTRFCVLDERPDDMPPATHIPIYDGGSDRALRANLDRVAEGMRAARAKGTPVLVFCGHGVRRSPLAAAWYLHRADGLPLEEAFARIRAARPQVEEPKEWLANAAELEEA